MKKVLLNSWMPFIFSTCLFIFLQLRIYNFGIGLRDEGFLYLNVSRILTGDIPYKDFFMTTTPGSFYVIALLSKLFGLYLIQSRILYLVLVVILLFLVNLLYKFKIFEKYILLISIAIFFLGTGAIGFYNLDALVFAIISFYFLVRGLDNKNGLSIFLSGLMMGLVFIFKQSYGIWIGLGFLIILLAERFKKYGFKDSFIGLYLLGGMLVAALFAYYFYINDAFSQALYYMGVFSREVKAHRNPFIIKAFIGIFSYVIFLMALKKFTLLIKPALILLTFVALAIFTKLGTSYLDLSRIYYALFIILPVSALVLTKRSKQTASLYRSAVFLLFLFFANASSGRELGVLMWVSPVYVPLIIQLTEHINKQQKKVDKRIVYSIAPIFILIQALLFSYNSINPQGSVFGKFKKSEMKYELKLPLAKNIKVTKETASELDYLISSIGKYPKSKKLLCFPYCPMMNVLTGRKSPSYYNFFYPEAILPSSQDEVINNLKAADTLVVIQKKGRIEPEALYEDVHFGKLKNFILKNYSKKLDTENFAVYSNQ